MWQQAFHKVPQVLSGHCTVEEGHSAVNEAKNRWGATDSEMVCEPLLVANIHNSNSHT